MSQPVGGVPVCYLDSYYHKSSQPSLPLAPGLGVYHTQELRAGGVMPNFFSDSDFSVVKKKKWVFLLYVYIFLLDCEFLNLS